MRRENEDQLHEMLCAYVLREGSAEERAEVESALAQSVELREERARIEATIGLVRGAMGEELLAPGVVEDVLASVRVRRPWYSHASVRIAAALTVVLGGVGVWALVEQRQGSSAVEPFSFAYEIFGEREDAGASIPREQGKDDQLAMVSKNEKRDASSVSYELSDRKLHAPDAALPRSESEAFKQPAPAAAGLGYTGEDSGVIAHFATPTGEDPSQGGETTSMAIGVGPPSLQDRVADGSSLSGYKENAAVAPANGAAAPARDQRSRDKPMPFGGRKLGAPVGTPRREGTAGVQVSMDAMSPASTPLAGPSSVAPSAPAVDSKDLTNIWRYADVRLGEPDTTSVDVEGMLWIPVDEESSAAAAQRLRGLGYVDEDRATWTPEQREHYVDEQCRRIFTGCYRRPNERPRDMFFRFWGDNPFEYASLDAQSTFSVDVDTASYALARRYLNEGNLPTKAQIRTEEFVNYFKADVQAPREGTFAIHTDLAPSRFSTDAQRWMLRVVVRGREVTKQERKPLALTFVIDVSGSMREQNRLEMVKHTLRLLLSQLDANDSIALVAFSDEARMILPMTSAGNRGLIESALFPLQPSGSTNSQGGLKMGYEAALAGLNPNATNRVVFLSDGVANVGVTDANQITNEVQRIREKGIYLNTIGVGMNNHNDVLLEQLADKGDGMCNYVDTADEAKRVMVDGFTGAFEPIARDVKIQVEFDPTQVLRYRLLGYENRAIADMDFRNDKVDAGEVGAGHQVTALYEIERSSAAPEKPLATVNLRWKAPRRAGPSADTETEQATEIAQPVLAAQATSFEGASAGYRRAVIVAQFAELLRRSQHARGESLGDLIGEAAKLEREMQDKDFTELSLLMQKSKALILASQPACDDLCQAVDLIRRNQLLRAENELLAKEQDTKLVDELERQNRELEERIRELLRRRMESR